WNSCYLINIRLIFGRRIYLLLPQWQFCLLARKQHINALSHNYALNTRGTRN
ncbi:hypothetical protein, partial [uncultured Gammaproteobacteria bacterium]